MKYFLTLFFLLITLGIMNGATTVEVFPVAKKQSSGIYVKKGEKLTINVSGKWSLWDKYKLVGGEGHPITAGEYGNWGTLLGKIGAGDIFVIGTTKEITSNDDGVLYLFPNKGKYQIEKQSGSLSVSVDGGTILEDFINTIIPTAKKITFDPKDGILYTNLFFKENANVEIYAFGNWTMWDGVYPETNAEGHIFEFSTEGIPWGRLYGGLGSSFGQFVEIFSIGEKTTYTTTKAGLLSLYPYIGNYVAVKNGKMDIYIIGGEDATGDIIKNIDEQVKNNSQSQALAKINEYRKQANLPELQVDPILSQAAFDHSKYLALNDTFSREQEQGKQYFTGVTFEDRLKKFGYTKRAREMFCQIDSTISAVDLFFDSVYHRLRLLDPELKYLGYGGYKVGDKTIHVFDFGYIGDNESKPDFEKVTYPTEDSKNNKIEWSGIENPEPFPPGTVKPLGYPVTIYFKEQIQKVVSAELFNDKDELVDSFVVTPESDVNNKQINAIVIIPKKIMNPSSKYTVSVKVKLANKPDEQIFKYSFETKSE